ncbi:hypothetical protein [Sphingomonas sp. OTU376]|uniref:hypothetical protein n=1 Tax=Sphingomonas sp. OTU376 TaxID=3043863 RepID=UPI00313BBE28
MRGPNLVEREVEIPLADNMLWSRILSGATNPDIKTLATRLIITRLRISVRNQETNLPNASLELRNFFVSNKFAHRDLAAIIGA